MHRDLKSSNVMITTEGQVKVLDFGLAKLVAGEGLSGDSLTQTGVVVGTLSYMSPEQALAKPVDQRSDLFSFGVVLYELLVGEVPFRGRSAAEVFDAILHASPPSPARRGNRVSEQLGRVVGKLLEKQPERRYQTAKRSRGSWPCRRRCMGLWSGPTCRTRFRARCWRTWPRCRAWRRSCRRRVWRSSRCTEIFGRSRPPTASRHSCLRP